jgi:uncharacterized protein YcaQ
LIKLSEVQLRWFRLRRSGLVEPFGSPEAAASALVGVQAQILPAAGVALWHRTPGLTYLAVDELLHHQRTLVKLWGQRGTLHLYPSQEWPLLHSALTRRLSWWARQFEQNGGDLAAYHALVNQVAELLRQRGTLGRSDLRAAGLALDEDHFSSWGGIFYDLVRHGHACHAGQVGNEGRFAAREFWLPQVPWAPPPTAAATAEVTRRFFHTYGPASLADLTFWSGLRAPEARGWLASLGAEVAEVEVEGQSRLALRADLAALNEPPPERAGWPVRLLYRFDPLLLAHKDKTWLIDAAYYKQVWRPAGHIEGTVLEYGRVAGTWRYDRKGSGLVVSVFPFGNLPAHVWAAVEAQAAGIAQFFGLPLNGLILGHNPAS